MAEMVKAAGVDPNIPFNGLPSPWKKDDAAWFKAHPQRAHRVRDRFPYERFKGEPSDLPNVVISKISSSNPGRPARQGGVHREGRQRTDAIGLMREMIEIAELRSRSLMRCSIQPKTMAGWSNFHELLAMIEQYESASARAVS